MVVGGLSTQEVRGHSLSLSQDPILNLWLPGGFPERVASKALYQTVLWVGAPSPPSALREPAEEHNALARVLKQMAPLGSFGNGHVVLGEHASAS